jgi:hypothetical protein
MAVSIPHFLKTVDEIEQNSWWAKAVGPKLNDVKLTYSIRDGVEAITEVPQEPLESLLLRVRRLTMNNSAERLIGIQKVLKQAAKTDVDRHLLDVWRKYWRLAFIKEPFFFEQNGSREVITPYKVYECFLNGHYFHTNNPIYDLLIYRADTPQPLAETQRFFQNVFHSVVLDLGLAAVGLHEQRNRHGFRLRVVPEPSRAVGRTIQDFQRLDRTKRRVQRGPLELSETGRLQTWTSRQRPRRHASTTLMSFPYCESSSTSPRP